VIGLRRRRLHHRRCNRNRLSCSFFFFYVSIFFFFFLAVASLCLPFVECPLGDFVVLEVRVVVIVVEEI